MKRFLLILHSLSPLLLSPLSLSSIFIRDGMLMRVMKEKRKNEGDHFFFISSSFLSLSWCWNMPELGTSCTQPFLPHMFQPLYFSLSLFQNESFSCEKTRVLRERKRRGRARQWVRAREIWKRDKSPKRRKFNCNYLHFLRVLDREDGDWKRKFFFKTTSNWRITFDSL